MGIYSAAYKFGSSLVDKLRAPKTPTGLTSLAGTPTSQPKPAAPVIPASPMRQPDGSVGSTGVLSQPKAPAPMVAKPPVPTVTSQFKAPAPAPVPISAGFTSTDPNIQARIASMQQEVAPPAPSPNSSPSPTPNINMAGTGSTGGSGSTGGYQTPSDIQKYREGVLSALRPSDQEAALRDELAQFRGDAKQGIAGLEGQGRGIPLGIVRGQQAQLQEQAGLQEQTLMERLAAASADRQAALQAAQTQLGFAQSDQEKADAQKAMEQAQLKPFEVNGSLVALNPATGQYEAVYSPPGGSAEGFTLSEGQQRYDVQGNLIAGATNPLAQEKAQLEIEKLKKDIAGTTDPYEQMTKQLQLQDLMQRVNGTTPADREKQQAQAGQKQMAVSTLQDKSALIDRILANPSSKLAVNPWGLASIPDPLQAANRERFKADLNQLLNQATIDNLIAVKASGGSFGALSEGELSLLKQSASPIASWLQPDGTIKASVNDFRNALNDMKTKTNQAISAAQQGDTGMQGINESLGSAPPTQADIQKMRDAGWSEEDILDLQNSFTNDLSKSQKGSTKVAVEARSYPQGANGGQCGRFVNNLTGIGMGDSYQSKLAKCDPSIGTPQNPPKPGDVFVMPYSWTGHTGIVTKVTPLQDGSYELSVTDSNYKLNEKVTHHKLNSSTIKAYARP